MSGGEAAGDERASTVADIAIAVPVRDEAERLPRLFAALARQTAAPPFTLCLFFDNCSDGSQGLVAALGPHLPYAIRVDCCELGGPPNAGLARRRAMALAASAAPGGVLMTTDADGVPAPGWLAANVAGLDAADIVAGRIVRGAGAGSLWHDRIEVHYDRLHALRRAIDPVPWEAADSHHWTSGASLTMPTATYRALGGFAPIPSGEDAALGDAAARAGLRLRRDAAATIRTSARRTGRATDGFAATLARLDATKRPPTVVHPADEAWRFRLQAEARRVHQSGAVGGLAAALALSPVEVERVAAECANGEAFQARIVGAPPGGMRSVALPLAEALLPSLEEQPLAGAA